MVERVPYNWSLDDERVCVTVFNGKADLLRLDYRYQNYFDQTEYFVEEEKYAKEIARNLGVTVSNHHWDVNKNQFN